MKHFVIMILLTSALAAFSLAGGRPEPADLGEASLPGHIRFAVCAEWPCPSPALRIIEIRPGLHDRSSQTMIRTGKLQSRVVLDQMASSAGQPQKDHRPKIKPIPGDCTLGGECANCGTLYQVTPTLWACGEVCLSCS